MKRSKLLSIPGLVLFLLFVTAVTAFAQSEPITSTVAISVEVQKPAEVIRFTHGYSFAVAITNTGEFTANVTGNLELYYAHVTDITATLPITANYAFTPTAFRSSAAFTLTEPVAPGEVVTLTVICAQDQVPGPVWADVEITATPLVTEVLGTSVFSSIAWNTEPKHDFTLTANMNPTNIISGQNTNLTVVLKSAGDITETRTVINLKGFAVTDYLLLGDAAGPVKVEFLTEAQAKVENSRIDQLMSAWKARKEHYITHMAAAMVAHPELADEVIASQVYTDPILVTFAEGDPVIFWNPEEENQEFVLSFVLRHNGDQNPSIFGWITGSYFSNLPPGEIWKYEWDGDNTFRFKEGEDFSIITSLQVFLPLINR